MSGYRATKGRESHGFECGVCRDSAEAKSCSCLFLAMEKARELGSGARVLRGAVVLSFIKPINSGATREAFDDANVRARKGAA